MRKNGSRRGGLIVILSALALGTVGCLRTQIIDQIGIVIANGIDQLPNGQILGTSVSYNIDSENKERIKIVVGRAYSDKGLRETLNSASIKPLMPGKIQVMVYGKEIAKKGVYPSVSTLLRDPQIGSGLYLCIVNGSSHDLMTKRYPEIHNIGKYLNNLIQHNVKAGFLISPTLHEFSRDYYMIGKDPVLPLIEQQGDIVKIRGAALFKEDRMAMQVDLQELFYLKLLHDSVTIGNQELILSDEEQGQETKDKKDSSNLLVVITPKKSSCNIIITNPEVPAFKIDIRLDVHIIESSKQLHLDDPEENKRMNIIIKQKIVKELEELIRNMQNAETDPIGLGSTYRAHVKGTSLTDKHWLKLLHNAEIKVAVNLKILNDDDELE